MKDINKHRVRRIHAIHVCYPCKTTQSSNSYSNRNKLSIQALCQTLHYASLTFHFIFPLTSCVNCGGDDDSDDCTGPSGTRGGYQGRELEHPDSRAGAIYQHFMLMQEIRKMWSHCSTSLPQTTAEVIQKVNEKKVEGGVRQRETTQEAVSINIRFTIKCEKCRDNR